MLDSEEVICVAGERLWFEGSVAIGSLNPEAGWIAVFSSRVCNHRCWPGTLKNSADGTDYCMRPAELFPILQTRRHGIRTISTSDMKNKRLKNSKDLFGAFIRKFHKQRRGRTGDAQTVYANGEFFLAVVAALLSLRMDQEPDVLLADAHELLSNARDFLAGYARQVDSDKERERASFLSLTLKESMHELGYKSYRGFWDAVDRTFDVKQALQLKTRKTFNVATLLAIQRRSAEGKALRARKARDAKRPSGEAG